MRILVSGQKQFGADVFRVVRAAGHDVLAVVAPPYSGSVSTSGGRLPDRLRSVAESAGVPWIPSDELRADRVPPGTDIIIAAHSHAFIGRQTRNKASVGAFGFHPSLLPLHRGRDAVRWAVHAGERVTGGSVYWLTDHVDGGPIAAQQHLLIPVGSSPQSLWREHLAPLGLRLIAQVLRDLSAGRKIAVPQDEELATWEPSWGRSPVFRPELPQLTDGRATAMPLVMDPAALYLAAYAEEEKEAANGRTKA
jgi:methionyl-tRNA formyltransferase